MGSKQQALNYESTIGWLKERWDLGYLYQNGVWTSFLNNEIFDVKLVYQHDVSM